MVGKFGSVEQQSCQSRVSIYAALNNLPNSQTPMRVQSNNSVHSSRNKEENSIYETEHDHVSYQSRVGKESITIEMLEDNQ